MQASKSYIPDEMELTKTQICEANPDNSSCATFFDTPGFYLLASLIVVAVLISILTFLILRRRSKKP